MSGPDRPRGARFAVASGSLYNGARMPNGDEEWVLGDDPEESGGGPSDLGSPFDTGGGADDSFDDSLDDIDASFGGGFGVARVMALGVFLSSLGGAWFAGTSTSDFVAHLDREVHAIHCALTPGQGPQLGDSGCKAVMMSPYSSFFRDQLWGGLPVSLWALAVFAFLAYRSLTIVVAGPTRRSDTFFLLAATVLPVGMSAVYGYLATTEVGATCLVCVGIYVSSGLCLLFAGLTHATAPPSVGRVHGVRGGGGGVGTFVAGVAEGTAFVLALSMVYLTVVPTPPKQSREGCGELVRRDDPAGAMLHMAAVPGGVPSIDVLDPLCPACRAFDERLETMELSKRLDRRTVLFPLDSACNWMVGDSLHPGACAVSEAMLCAGGAVKGRSGDPQAARAILDWAFEHQQALMDQAKTDPKGLKKRIVSQFPAVKGCVGSSRARSKLTKGLRWAVRNALPVLTPQLYIDGKLLCGEDTDMGLDYSLGHLIGGRGGAS